MRKSKRHASPFKEPSSIQSADQAPKTEEDLARTLSLMKTTLQGSPDVDAQPEQVQQLVQAILSESLLPLLVSNIHRLPFETRKDTQTIISNVFRFRNPGSTSNEPDALREVLQHQPGIVVNLCYGYEKRESAGACGGILKEALKWDAVAAVILYDEPRPDGQSVDIFGDIDISKPSSGQGVFWKFFDWIDKSSFEVSADAFDCFRLILTKHKQLVSQFININFDMFFEKYNNILVKSDSYVTKRQSLKLLGEILLDRQFYEVMTRYVDSGDNLKLVMWQLKDERRMVQYEAFHVFKVSTSITSWLCLPQLITICVDFRREPKQIIRGPEVLDHEQAASFEVPAEVLGRSDGR